MELKLTCINCPVGCRMNVTVEDGTVTKVEGNSCKLGIKYAQQEAVAPQRIVTAVVKVEGSQMPLSIKTEKTIPKEKIFDCMKELERLNLKAPIEIGSIILENVCDTGVNVIATKTII